MSALQESADAWDSAGEPTLQESNARLSFVEIDKQTGEFIQFEGEFEAVVDEMLALLPDRGIAFNNPIRIARWRERIMRGKTPQVRAMNLRSMMNATGHYTYAWQVIE